jgi:hypothetical protein
MAERLLGHDLDGQRIVFWSQINAWTAREEFFIESAPDKQIRLHHVPAGLLEMLSEALNAPHKAVA